MIIQTTLLFSLKPTTKLIKQTPLSFIIQQVKLENTKRYESEPKEATRLGKLAIKQITMLAKFN